MTTTTAPDITTVTCDNEDHTDCLGYVVPLVYSNTRPCQCDCHATLGRDFPASMWRAAVSYYGSEEQAKRNGGHPPR